MKKKAAIPVIIAIACLLLISAVAVTHRSKPLIICSVDRSRSTDPVRLRYNNIVDVLIKRIQSGTRLLVYRFDTAVSQVYDGYPTKPRDLWQVQDRQLKPIAKRRGTRLDMMLKQITQVTLPNSSEQTIGIVVITDGGNDGRPLAPYAMALGKDKRIRAVWLVGLQAHHRLRLDNEFRTVLGDRLVTSGLDDVANGIDRFNELMRKERHDAQ